MKNTLVFIICLFPSFLLAKEYADFDLYNDNTKYSRGSYVRHSNNLWVARHKVKGSFPKNSRYSWAKVQLTEIGEWQPKRVYKLGKSVSFNGKNYFSISMWPIPLDSQYVTHKWVEFSHPAIGFELPSLESSNPQFLTLIGVDENQNNIRDDYEIKIVMSNKTREIKEFALKAGENYHHLMVLKDNIDAITADYATEVILGLTLAELCKRKINFENPLVRAWKKSDYFNTIDRVEVNFLIQNRLSDMVNNNLLEASLENPCTSL